MCCSRGGASGMWTPYASRLRIGMRIVCNSGALAPVTATLAYAQHSHAWKHNLLDASRAPEARVLSLSEPAYSFQSCNLSNLHMLDASRLIGPREGVRKNYVYI